MDPTCRFGPQYRGTQHERDPMAELHVRNCADCQDSVLLVSEA